jgi:type VI secretion system secreted protein VgrG
MPEYTQQTRLLVVNTTLGGNELMLESFSGTEAVSSLFHFELSLLSENRSIVFDDIVGKPISVGVNMFGEGKLRWFHGVVCRFTQVPSFARLGRYRAHVVPAIWYLSRTADCRIYQNKTAVEIIDDIFAEHKLTDYEKKISGSHPTREYCVQYRETALNFVMRLMEEEGIYFYFKHEQTKHTLVMADSTSGWETCKDQSSFRLETQDIGYRRLDDAIFSWGYGREVRPGKYALNDFNFETPKTDLTSSVPSSIELGGNADWEVFDYPGGFSDRDGGGQRSVMRMEEEEAACTRVHGESNARAFTSGHKFTLTDHERADQNAEYVLLSVTHQAEQGGFSSEMDNIEAKYTNIFMAMPSDVLFRPARVTRKPAVGGPQTAVVVGKSGEEIWTDKYGRVKVQFHWDRRGKGDENSSCWVRVSQPWAGQLWGAINIPRIGQEVIVDFLEGDPDRPIITGRVYNAVEIPPYGLPENQTITTFKTNSHKSEGFNELRFDDRTGEEQIFVHAQKNFDTRVKNDSFETVVHDKHTVVEHDRFVHIKHDRHKVVDNDEIVTIGKDQHTTIEGKQCVEIKQSMSTKINQAVAVEYGQGYTHKVQQGYLMKAGTFMQVEGGTDITLKCGSSSIVIDSAGVTIKGAMVTIDASGLCKINSGPGSPALVGVPGQRVPPTSPAKAEDADVADPGKVDELRAQQREAGVGKYGAPQLTPFTPQRGGGAQAASSGGGGEQQQPQQPPPTHFFEYTLLDTNGKPVPGERYRIQFSDNTYTEGTLDENGHVRVDGAPAGETKITFPYADQQSIG